MEAVAYRYSVTVLFVLLVVNIVVVVYSMPTVNALMTRYRQTLSRTHEPQHVSLQCIIYITRVHEAFVIKEVSDGDR